MTLSAVSGRPVHGHVRQRHPARRRRLHHHGHLHARLVLVHRKQRHQFPRDRPAGHADRPGIRRPLPQRLRPVRAVHGPGPGNGRGQGHPHRHGQPQRPRRPVRHPEPAPGRQRHGDLHHQRPDRQHLPGDGPVQPERRPELPARRQPRQPADADRHRRPDPHPTDAGVPRPRHVRPERQLHRHGQQRRQRPRAHRPGPLQLHARRQQHAGRHRRPHDPDRQWPGPVHGHVQRRDTSRWSSTHYCDLHARPHRRGSGQHDDPAGDGERGHARGHGHGQRPQPQRLRPDRQRHRHRRPARRQHRLGDPGRLGDAPGLPRQADAGQQRAGHLHQQRPVRGHAQPDGQLRPPHGPVGPEHRRPELRAGHPAPPRR